MLLYESRSQELGSLMTVERSRLLSLIEYAQQSARLRGKPAASIAAHHLFSLYEHELQSLPGIRINCNGAESEDEVWLVVERLHETRPPDVPSLVLKPWLQMTQGPVEEPRLRETTDGASLIDAGTHSSVRQPVQGKLAIAPEATVMLTDFPISALVKAQFANYLEGKWRPWAEEEKLRRRTIRLYSQLFTLKQQCEGAIVEAQLELVMYRNFKPPFP